MQLADEGPAGIVRTLRSGPASSHETHDLAQMFWATSNDLLVVTDQAGLLRSANDAWHRVLGWEPSTSAPVRVCDLVHDDDRTAVEDGRGQENGTRFDCVEMRLQDVSGSYHAMSWSGVTDGHFWYLAGRDVTGIQQAERAARDMGEFWQATIDSMQGTVAVLDDAGRVVAVNAAWRAFGARLGRSTPSDLGRNYLDICDTVDDPAARRAAEAIRSLLAGRKDHPASFDYLLEDRWFSFTATAFVGRGAARIVIAHNEVTDRRRLEDEASSNAAALDHFEIAVIGASSDGRIDRWSDGAEHLYGWTRAEATGRILIDLIDPQPVSRSGRSGSVVEGRYLLLRRDGSRFVGHLKWTQLDDGEGRSAGVLAVTMDVSAQARDETAGAQASSQLRAVTDSMTEGLVALDQDGGVTMMNRAAELMLGWTLDEVRGQRLHDVTRHHGYDGSVHDASTGCAIAGADAVGGVLTVDDDVFTRRNGLELPVSYTVTPLETGDGVDGSVVVFMDATHVRVEQERVRRELDAVVRIQRVAQALEEDRFVLYAQPIVDLSSMQVTQQELLLRVEEKDGTISGPGDYLGTAEEFDLMGDIDRWVIRRAIDLAASGHAVEVNVSADSVSDPLLLTDIEQWLVGSGADPALLVFEITETAMVENEQVGRWFVDQIHRLGCKVALDDFGTGYCGFAYLKQLPVDYLKIDIEFVRDLTSNAASRHVVEAVVSLAHGFGFQTVAEGVEDADTMDLLISLGVDYAQGYHLGRPAPLPPTIQLNQHEEQT